MPASEVSSAYQRLHTIVDKATEVEKLRQQLESQMAKIKDVEAESFQKMKEALGEVHRTRKELTEKEAMIVQLQAQSQELEELKKRDIDRVERELETVGQELKGLRADYAQLARERDALSHIKSDHEKLNQEMGKLRAENSDLQLSVARERKAMIEEMTRERGILEDGSGPEER